MAVIDYTKEDSCQVCRKVIRLTDAGVLRYHGTRSGGRCPGTGHPGRCASSASR